MRRTVRRGGDAERLGEARRERADAAQADLEANVGDAVVGVAQQRGRALEAAREEVAMRRLAERAPELAAEVRGRQVRSAGKCRHLELLAVPRVDQVLRTQQVPGGR